MSSSPAPAWRYRYAVRGYWLNYAWTLHLYLGDDLMWFQYSTATSRRRAQKQAAFWIRLGMRKFNITEHVTVEQGQWRVRGSIKGRRR